jgi:hypothetical protein
MSRLPTIHGDNGTWDTILNDYLAAGRNVNVKDYGAVGDGVTNDTAAFVSARDAAAALASWPGGGPSRGQVTVPPGVYLVNANAVLTPTTATVIPGVHWQGSGWFTSIIRFGTLSGTTWLYDNGATARQFFNTFADLAFEGTSPASVFTYTDVPTNANGFKITSAGNEQGFRFDRCRFGYFDTLFDMEGTNTASEMKFVDCKIHNIRSTVYKLNNAQSFNHEFFGCDVESCWSDIFSITGSGGGAIKVYGGSWILQSQGTTPTYFFKATGSSGAWGLPFVFSGMRFEFHGDYNRLISISNAQQIDLDFQDCLFGGASGTTARTAFCTIGGYAVATFQKCSFYEADAQQMKFAVDTANPYGQAGVILFDKCALPVDWSDRCTLANYFGKISAIGCYGIDPGNQAAGVHYAHDFDLWWDAATPGQVGAWAGSGGTLRASFSPQGPSLRLKIAEMKMGTEFWPTNAEHTLKMPKNAMIKAIHIRKPAAGADTTVTTMKVGRNDKTGTDHLISNSAAMNVTHSGDVNDYYYHVGSTTNERTLRLYSSAATTGTIQGGLCIVEYY